MNSQKNRFLKSYLNVEAVGDVVGGGVHLSDDDVLLRHLISELVVDGGELLAVPAPRRVEFCDKSEYSGTDPVQLFSRLSF